MHRRASLVAVAVAALVAAPLCRVAAQHAVPVAVTHRTLDRTEAPQQDRAVAAAAIPKRVGSAAKGAAIGLVLGVTIGEILARQQVADNRDHSQDGIVYALFGVLGAGAGALIGAVVGATIGG